MHIAACGAASQQLTQLFVCCELVVAVIAERRTLPCHGDGWTASSAAILYTLRGEDAFDCNSNVAVYISAQPSALLQVAQHNTAGDCWVSFLGGVYDVTRLIQEHPGGLTEPILAAAGTDISHWFDPQTRDVRTHIDPHTQLSVPYCPKGVFLHVTPIEPTTSYDCSVQVPWWKDVTLRVGLLSGKTRLVRVKNVLTEQEDVLEVPAEETVGQVRQRYLALNAHAASYTWKALAKKGAGGNSTWEFRDLDLNRTLSENGVAEESELYESLDMHHDSYIPVLHVYWNDDLTVA